MTGNPWEVQKGIRPVTKSTTRKVEGKGAESIPPLPFYMLEKEGWVWGMAGGLFDHISAIETLPPKSCPYIRM